MSHFFPTIARWFLLLGASGTLHAFELVHEAPDKTVQHYFLSMKGAYEHVSGDTKQAARTYQQITQLEPDSQALEHASLRLAFERGDYQTVLRKAAQVAPSNKRHKEAAINVAQSYLFTQQAMPAIALIEKLKVVHPHDSRLDYYLGLCHIKAEQFDKAHALIDASLARQQYESRHFLFHFLKAKLCFLQNNMAPATHHVEKSLLLHPRFAKAMVLKGVIAEKRGNNQNALLAYENYIAMTKDPEITKKVISLCFATQNFARARELLSATPRDTPDYFHDMALIEFRLGNSESAHKNIDRALEKNTTYTRAQDLKTHFLVSERKFDALADLYKRWLGAQPSNKILIRRWCHSVNKGVPAATITNTLKTVAGNKATLPLCFALADQLHQAGSYDAARVWYHQALKLVPSTAGLTASKLYFQVACCHYREKAWGKASIAVKKALACSPAYPSTHNLAALLIIQTDGDRQAARMHVDKALLADPKNKDYLATKSQLMH